MPKQSPVRIFPHEGLLQTRESFGVSSLLVKKLQKILSSFKGVKPKFPFLLLVRRGTHVPVRLGLDM